jgi:uncharacterized protein YgiM (DUF1202 family)
VNARQPVRIVIPVMMVLSVMAGTVWAETVFVQAKTAQLRAGKTSLDPVVANVKYGEALQVRKTEGKWMEVETGSGTTGWIFSNKTSTVKPSGSEDDLSRLGRSFRGKEASDATASAGARGLDKVSEEYAKRSGISQRDRDTVDRMTAYKITDQEVEDFLKKGELGEYAK